MNVTDVRIDRRYPDTGNIVASVTPDNLLRVHGVDVRRLPGSADRFVRFPGKAVYGRHADVIHPLNQALLSQIPAAIVDKAKEIKDCDKNPADRSSV